MLAGTFIATVLESRGVSIHGDSYADLLVQTDEQQPRGEASRVRVAAHSWRGPPAVPGDRVEFRLLMGQVTEARVLAR